MLESGGARGIYECCDQVWTKCGIGYLFQQYQKKEVHILKKSVVTMKDNHDSRKVFECIVIKDPYFK